MHSSIPTRLLRCTACALLIAAPVAIPAVAQQAETAPPPPSGGFNLENIGRPTRQTTQPQVAGPINPDAPIATRPLPRPTPAPTQSNTAPSQRTSQATPTITLSPPASTRQAIQAPPVTSRQTATTTNRVVTATPGAQAPAPAESLPAAPGAQPASTALPAVRDPMAYAPIVRNDAGSSDFPWAWLLAALVLLGGLVYYLRSRNTAWQPAVGVPLNEAKADPEADSHRRDALRENIAPEASPSLPVALAAPPVEPTAPAAQTGEGIEVIFQPDYAAATFTRVAMRYVVTIRNSGSKPVEDIAIRAAMIPASAQQDQEVSAFMADETRDISHHVETLAAGQSIDIEGEMALPLDQARAVRYGQRLLFVPVAAFAIAFTRDQSARRLPLAYMVGVDSGGAQGKMGPLRLDLGPKTYNQVGQRPLALASAA